MTQNVILQGWDFEKSRPSVKVNHFSINTSPSTMRTHVKFHCDLIASFSGTVEKSLTERWPAAGERREKGSGIKEKHVDSG